MSGSQTLGPLQPCWESLKSPLMELKNWRPRRRNNLNCSLLRCLVKKGHTKTTTKIHHHQSFVVQKSLHLLYKSKLFQYEHSSTFAIAPISTSHLSSPALQVPLDDKFQGLRLENRLTTKDPSRFWPGTKMGWWLAGSGGCLRYIYIYTTCLQVSEHDDIDYFKRLTD